MLKEIGKCTFVEVKWDFLLHRSGQRDREQCGFWVWPDSFWWSGSIPNVWEGFPGTDPCPQAGIHPQRCCHRLHPQWHVGTCLAPLPHLILPPLKQCAAHRISSPSQLFGFKKKRHKSKWGLPHGYIVVGSVNNKAWNLGLPQEWAVSQPAWNTQAAWRLWDSCFPKRALQSIPYFSRLRDLLGLTGKGEICKWKTECFSLTYSIDEQTIDFYNLILAFKDNRHLSSYF